MLLLRVIALSIFIAVDVNAATTYYVSTTGSDSANGSAATPYRTIKRCIQSPIVPGDTCIVKSGTYQASDIGRTDIAVYIATSQGSVSGTSANPITIKSEVYRGAEIKVPSVNAGTYGFYITLPGYIIEGFDINSTGTIWNTGSSGAAAGIYAGGSNTTIRRNYIHNIARTMCSESNFGHDGILLGNGSNILIEYNTIHEIGRLRNGEASPTTGAICSTTHYQHDHGIYSAGASFVTIKNNVIYDSNRGYPIHLFCSGCTHDNVNIYHNTISGHSPTNAPAGQIILSNTVTNTNIKNNIFHDAPLGYPVNWFSATATNVSISYNIQDSEDADATNDMQNPNSKPGSGVTNTGNIFNATLGLTNTISGSEDFTLLSTSDAINAGISLGYTFCGSAEDMGAFETCGASSASVSGLIIDVVMQSAFPPVQVPSSTGWSFSCVGAGCTGATMGSVSLKSGSSSTVSIAIIGITACNAGSTYTVSYNGTTGSASDSINIGGSTNQKIFTFSSLAVTNNCSGSPPDPPAGFFAYYPLDGNVEDASGGGHDGTQSGGSFVSAKYGQGFKTTSGSNDNFTIPYGNSVNIGTQSFTLAMAINVPASDVGLTKNYMGTDEGTGAQRLYILSRGNTWGVVVQEDGAGWAASDLTVEPGWNLIVLRVDASTNTATLCKNGYTGTSGYAVNTYTDHTLPSHIRVGLPVGFGVSSTPTAVYDEVRIWSSLQSCADIYAAWEPPVTAPGTHNQVAHRFQYVYEDASGNPVNLGTAINQDQVVTRSGGVAIEFQVDCANVTDCTSASYRLWYSFDGVNFSQPIPERGQAAAEGLSMWGDSSDHDINTSANTCPLTGALTCTDGGTILTSRSTTPVTLTKNTSYVVRFIVKTAWATWTDFYLQLRHQDGSLLSSYTPTNGAHMIMHDTDAHGP